MVDIKKIAIGGELRPLHYGMASLAEWCDLTGSGLQDLSSLGNNVSLNAAIQLIYCGLKHGARRCKEKFNYSVDDVADWIDEEGMDIFNEAMEVFTASMAKLNPEKKKKVKK
jgi:hypothetical protein